MLLRLLRFSAAVAAFGMAFAGSVAAAPADDLREAQKLFGEGRNQPAMDKVDAYLTAQPRDAQGRFLKGLLLTEQKKVAEAIQVFTGLTEDFPELPEPYNNLAVLYASQGNYDKAKSVLELAIHANPRYATAHENLGDIHAQLAIRSYGEALQLDRTNATAQAKLARIQAAVAKPGADEKGAVGAAIDSWAKAWSAKDVKAYLAAYAPDFEPPGGEARPAWEKQRAELVQRPGSVEVSVKIQSIAVEGDSATAVFQRSVRAEGQTTSSTNTFRLSKIGGRWLIRQERDGG
jgi:tetratricopeptide (TPR) repeat protein